MIQNLVLGLAIAIAAVFFPPAHVAHSYEGYVLSPHQLIVAQLPPVMLRIAIAESRLDPAAKNAHSSAKGLFQILDGTWKSYGCTGYVYNPYDNIQCARRIYEDSGTTAWNASKPNWED